MYSKSFRMSGTNIGYNPLTFFLLQNFKFYTHGNNCTCYCKFDTFLQIRKNCNFSNKMMNFEGKMAITFAFKSREC